MGQRVGLERRDQVGQRDLSALGKFEFYLKSSESSQDEFCDMVLRKNVGAPTRFPSKPN
jgi:hypothetical protein